MTTYILSEPRKINMIYRIDQHYSFLPSEEKILNAFLEHGDRLGTGELAHITGLEDDTILPNCKKLIKKGLLYDKEKSQKGKYRLVNPTKLPTFLIFRNRNKTEATKTMKDLFFLSSSSIKQNKQEQFANNIGMYILYVLIERINPEGPWTSDRFKSMIENDPRMKNLDILRDTWVADTIDSNFLIEQFDKYVNNENQTYQELVQTFESTFPNKILFHERIDKLRKSNKKQNKKPLSTTAEDVSDYDSEGYQDYLNRKKKHGVKMN